MSFENDLKPQGNHKKPRAIAVVGPTATGKTALGVAIAKHLGTDVISADSRVIYKELDIGTAKPTSKEMQGVRHHMINVANPPEQYSVSRYAKEADVIMKNLIALRKTPVVVGGNGFYTQALLQGGFIPSVPPDEIFRQEMRELADAHSKGSAHLYALLESKDPQRAKDLHPNDTFRIIRALEIIRHTGKPVPQVKREHQPENWPVDTLWIGLTFADRDKHRALIDDRIGIMLAEGWLDEVRGLLTRYPSDAEALQQAHGYPEWVQYLTAQRSYESALAQVELNTHQYARRQRTWFNRNPKMRWLNVDTMTKDVQHQAALSWVDTFLSAP